METKKILEEIKVEFYQYIKHIFEREIVKDLFNKVKNIIDKKIEDLYIPEVSFFRERACLVAFLSKVFPSSLEPAEDCKDDPEFNWIIYMITPNGQISYHLHDDDLDLFKHVKRNKGVKWDGHDTHEKYRIINNINTTKKWAMME